MPDNAPTTTSTLPPASARAESASQDDLRGRVATIRASGLFDDGEYDFRDEARLQRRDPVLHYLTSGEARGGRPSRNFDPDYYRRKHRVQGDSPLIHYILFGRQQGLRTLPIVSEFTFAERRFREGFKRCVLLAPDAGDEDGNGIARRILKGLRQTHDVIVIMLDPSHTASNFAADAASVVLPPPEMTSGWEEDPLEAAHLCAEVAEHYRPESIVCCGLRSRELVFRFFQRSIPTVTLTWHETSHPNERIRLRLYRFSAAIVFATGKVLESHIKCYPWIASRKMAVAPLLSDEAGASEDSANLISQLISDARTSFARLAHKHKRVTTDRRSLDAVTKNAIQLHDLKLRIWENCFVGGLATGGVPAFPLPRLLLGFNERSYAAEKPGDNTVIDCILEERIEDFRRPVIRPTSSARECPDCRVALHGHYYYPELAEEMLLALAANQRPIDLYLSTDTEEKAQQLSTLLARFDRTADIRAVPNRGRDLGPLFTGFLDIFGRGYDVIGHVHGKKTLQAASSFGERWRQYLLENTVGGRLAVADRIIEAFASDETIGLVFPEDDRVLGWELNVQWAMRLASMMGLSGNVLHPSFDFPAGSFFWCRPRAMQPLLSLGLDWTDYPEEPLPHDGTILHAIERMLTFSCEEAGFEYRTVHVADTSR